MVDLILLSVHTRDVSEAVFSETIGVFGFCNSFPAPIIMFTQFVGDQITFDKVSSNRLAAFHVGSPK